MKIIIAPREMHKEILKEFRADPFDDVKVVSKSDLELYLVPQVKEQAIFYMMTKLNLSYDVASMYLEFIPFVNIDIDNAKIRELKKIYNDLNDNGLIVHNKLIKNIYETSEIKIIGYHKDDLELNYLLNKLNVRGEYISLQTSEVPPNSIASFEKIEEEVYYVLNQIAELIDTGISIDDIYIFRRNSEYDYYLNKFSKLFGFDIDINNEEIVTNTGFYAEFIKILEKTNDINESLEQVKNKSKDNPDYDDFELIVKNHINPELPFEKQKEYLVGSFKNIKLKKVYLSNCVHAISSPIYIKNKFVFIVGFAQGYMPSSQRDDKYLNSTELNLINRLNQKQKTRIDFDMLCSFIQSENKVFLSFARKSINAQYYLSPISTALSLGEIAKELPKTFYSEKVLSYIYTNLKDLYTFYNEAGEDFYKIRDVITVPYNIYNNKYKGKVNAYSEDEEIILSTTSLEEYSLCPYKYYLSHKIFPEDKETNFYLTLGIITHNLLESSLNQNFNFNEAFDRELMKISLKCSEKFLIINNIKDQLEEACKTVKLRLSYATNVEYKTEQNFAYQISSNTKIVGRTDFLEIIDNKYFICIDYKTGSTSFDESKIKYGVSSQLPTYALLCMSDENYQNLQLGGLYINNVITSSTKELKSDDNLIFGYLKLNGKTLNDMEFVSKFDSTIADGKSSFVSLLSISKKDDSLQGKSLCSKSELDFYINTVLELYKNMDINLRNNNFEIKPLFFNENDNACRFCSYKDICHVRRAQFQIIKKEEHE